MFVVLFVWTKYSNTASRFGQCDGQFSNGFRRARALSRGRLRSSEACVSVFDTASAAPALRSSVTCASVTADGAACMQ